MSDLWLSDFEVLGLRNLRHNNVSLDSGLNLLIGENAQGKTSVLEAVAILSRGRSFRTERVESLMSHGESSVVVRGRVFRGKDRHRLEVALASGSRRLAVDGEDVRPADFIGQCPAFVYSTDGLKVVRGPMRDRRAFFDRAASLVWPVYRSLLQSYARVLAQRNACLQAGRHGLEVWNERIAFEGARLRIQRAAFLRRVRAALKDDTIVTEEKYEVAIKEEPSSRVDDVSRQFLEELAHHRDRELRRRQTLVGPHRDPISLLINGHEAAETASSGQARCFLLALTLAFSRIYAQETTRHPVMLLDDLDSELDAERAIAVCRQMTALGQVLVTTAHASWADPLVGLGRRFRVSQGQIFPIGCA